MADYSYLIDRLRNAAGGDLGRKMCADAADVIAALQSKCDAQDKYIDALTKQSVANRRMAERTCDSAMSRIKAYDAIMAGLQRDKAVLQRKFDVLLSDLKKNWICYSCKKRIPTKEWYSCKDIAAGFDEDGCVTCRNYEWRGVKEGQNENQTG